VRGALIYNHLIESNNLEKKYQLIQEGDKIKFLYLREPNPLGTHVITFAGEVPEEFNLREYIDYDMMFEKSFLDPLNSLLSCIGWQVREQATLEGLFS
jgi:DNA polymerase elongation subunit (family B)